MSRSDPALHMRLARRADAGEILDIYKLLVRETATSFELQPPSEEEVSARIGEKLEFAPWLVAERDGAVAGYAYAQPHRSRGAYQWSVETSVFVARSVRGQGVGRAVMSGLLGLLELQGFRRCLAGITLPNRASVSLHEGLGFEELGTYRRIGFKHGRWHDVGWWQRSLGDETTDPVPPRLLAGVLSPAELRAGIAVSVLETRLSEHA